ncbi:GNAT family N-acetyltransferase [Massilia sp. CF038]|uniref:GNAT family N-acetyltransferase n=1 Tax=Massilia sp. CF038 TaxID=1881045 RepID=UPI00091E594A|nr:GNAT family N-acetyltransferase [Massilia sp. CF038]SHG96793.1 Ribosomal protein S18 acetylase RimI [Massilia sp. CF038]
MSPAQTPSFRRALPSDIPAMSAIRLAVKENVLSDPTRVTTRMYEDYLDLLGRGWVAEIDGAIVGFSYANSTDASIWALFIAPAFEGRGLARRLLALAVSWLFEQGQPAVRLSTGARTRAAQFYALQGWTVEREDEKDTYFILRQSDWQSGQRAAA